MKRFGLVVLLLVAVSVAVGKTKPEGSVVGKTLEERVLEMEQVVMRDLAQPGTTMLSRLEAVEAAMREMGKGAKGEVKEDQQMKREVEGMQKQLAELERRVKAAEGGKGNGGGDPRELQRSVAQVARAVDDLQDRVKRLESKR